MRHKELVKLAGLWLQSAKQCNPVFMELGSAKCAEFPDAIGWTANECIIVECKISKEDLLKNSKKKLTLGNQRYFLLPYELYEKCQHLIPENWGILTTSDGYSARQERLRGSKDFLSDLKNEVNYLRSRILGIQRYGKALE